MSGRTGSRSGVSIAPGSVDLVWKAEDSIVGRVILELPSGVDSQSISDAQIKRLLNRQLPTHATHVVRAKDIEAIDIVNVDRFGSGIEVAVDITPTKEAGQRWAFGSEMEGETYVFYGGANF